MSDDVIRSILAAGIGVWLITIGHLFWGLLLILTAI